MDLSGKVIVKVQLREEIFRVLMHNDEITYDELVLMIQRLFKGQLKTEDDIVIKYKDEDEEMVTINDSTDLSFAIQCCRVLRLRIYLKKDEDLKMKVLKDLPIGIVRSELRDLRDRVNRMLDLLDVEDDKKIINDSTGADEKSPEKTGPGSEFKGMNKQEQSGTPLSVIPSPSLAREFDPLQQQISASSKPQVIPPASTSNGPSSQLQNTSSQHSIRQQPSSTSTTVENTETIPNMGGQYNTGHPPPPNGQQHQPSQMNYHQYPQAQTQAQPPPQQLQQPNLPQVKQVLPPPMPGSYPVSSTPTSMLNYPYVQQQYGGHFPSTPVAFAGQPRPNAPVSGPLPGQPPQPGPQYQADMYRQNVSLPQQQQYGPSQPSYPPPGSFPPPPSGPAGPNNPYTRSTTGQY